MCKTLALSTLFVCAALGKVGAAGDSEVPVASKTSLAMIRGCPEAFRRVPFKIDVLYSGVGELYNPFYTPYEPSSYLNFHAWGATTELWTREGFRDVHALFYVDRRNRKVVQKVLDLAPMTWIEIQGVVGNTFAGRAWIEVSDVSSKDHRLSRQELGHLVKASILADRREYTRAMVEFGAADLEHVPAPFAAQAKRAEARCALAAGNSTAVQSALSVAHRLDPDGTETSGLLEDAQRLEVALREGRPSPFARQKERKTETPAADEAADPDAVPGISLEEWPEPAMSSQGATQTNVDLDWNTATAEDPFAPASSGATPRPALDFSELEPPVESEDPFELWSQPTEEDPASGAAAWEANTHWNDSGEPTPEGGDEWNEMGIEWTAPGAAGQQGTDPLANPSPTQPSPPAAGKDSMTPGAPANAAPGSAPASTAPNTAVEPPKNTGKPMDPTMPPGNDEPREAAPGAKDGSSASGNPAEDSFGEPWVKPSSTTDPANATPPSSGNQPGSTANAQQKAEIAPPPTPGKPATTTDPGKPLPPASGTPTGTPDAPQTTGTTPAPATGEKPAADPWAKPAPAKDSQPPAPDSSTGNDEVSAGAGNSNPPAPPPDSGEQTD